jgi:hypothetical protein
MNSSDKINIDDNKFNFNVKSKKSRPSIRFSTNTGEVPINIDNNIEINDFNKNYKSVSWDNETLEEQELERKNNPKKKIDEPKTPYLPYEEGDDEYMRKLNEINKLTATVSNIIFYIILIERSIG